MRVAVIGCGASGLVSARHLASTPDVTFDVYEKSDALGGTWVYTEAETDRHGLPTHSSMYKNLRTNLPKEVMQFSGLKYKRNDASYLPVQDVINYLNEYADLFHLRKFIKFEHLVKSVKPGGDGWELIAVDLNKDEEFTEFYDAVMVCNGHYSVPIYPKIKNQEKFKGLQMHSRKYKTPEPFRDKRVLLIGIGPSGQDISFDLSHHAQIIYLSNHSPEYLASRYPDNVVFRPDVSHFQADGNTVVYKDGTSDEIDAVLYCTGYSYSFPFLDESCGIRIVDNYVSPLYKQMFSIVNPSLVFIGIPFRTFIFPMLETQARCFMSVLRGDASLPSEADMLFDTRLQEDYLKLKGYPRKRYHMLGLNVKQYIHQLVKVFNIDPVPDVIYDIYAKCAQSRKRNLATYRNEVFTIVDSKTFTSTGT